MRSLALVYPMFAMVVLSAVVLVILFRGRVSAVKAGRVSAQYFRLYQGEVEPEASAKASRHFSNLFEAPTLFYAGCLVAMLAGDTGPSLVVIAWLYVATRLAHAYVHLGGNRLRKRMRVYFVSWFVLLALWLHVVVYAAVHA
jgi:hypothetical protein